MSYEFPVDHRGLFEERTGQFLSFGLPVSDLRGTARVHPLDLGRRAGWLVVRVVGVGSKVLRGRQSFTRGDDLRNRQVPRPGQRFAAPGPAESGGRIRQGSTGIRLEFERRILSLPYRSGEIELPVHILSVDGRYEDAPVLLLSGGVDGWKMDMHPLVSAFAKNAGVTVVAFDQPGTGESPVPLDAFGDEVIDGLVATARALGNGQVAHLGVSFGGNFAVRSGLTGAVDAVINIGAPVKGAFETANAERLVYGMGDIVGNALGFDAPATKEALVQGLRAFDRSVLMTADDGRTPMLVVNGADDVHIPLSDTTLFEERPNTQVHVIPDAGHCAVTKLPELTPMMIDWLRDALSGTAPRTGR
ncbi:alpha/beta fold hydrolase [Rhodococcus sp. 1.20]